MNRCAGWATFLRSLWVDSKTRTASNTSPLKTSLKMISMVLTTRYTENHFHLSATSTITSSESCSWQRTPSMFPDARKYTDWKSQLVPESARRFEPLWSFQAMVSLRFSISHPEKSSVAPAPRTHVTELRGDNLASDLGSPCSPVCSVIW